jgi:hypothetical protein
MTAVLLICLALCNAIERFQGLVKTHRSAMDCDAGYIERLLMEALQEAET